MVNTDLLAVITPQKLAEMGFIETNDGSGDDRGTSWQIVNDNFYLMVDAWGEVELARCNPDSDFIKIRCTTLFDLQCVVDFIA